MAPHAQVQGFQAQVEEERVERGRRGAQVAHQLDAGLDDVGQWAEGLDVLQAVVALIRLDHLREAAATPVEGAAVHDHAAHAGGVAIDVLGGRVDDDVGAMLEGAAQVGGAEGVVDQQRGLHLVGDGGEFLEIEDVQAGVADGLGKQAAGVRL